MKTSLIIVVASLLALAGVQAQTIITTNQIPGYLLGGSTNSGPTLTGGLQEILDAAMTATNYGGVVYGTYAPDVKSGSKVGGGALLVYNFNNYVGTALGVDWLGQFSMVSANVTLQAPVYPFRTSHFSFLTNVVVSPLVIVGIGKPFGGAGNSTGPAGIQDYGGYIHIGHWLGGNFAVGGTYGQWQNAGNYSGTRYHLFFGWEYGF